MADVLAVVSITVAGASALFTWLNFRDRRQSERTMHVARISAEVRERRSQVADYSWQLDGKVIVARNDGPSSVTIESIALGYGNRWAYDRATPVRWILDVVPPGRMHQRLLPPGGEISVEAPDDSQRTDIGILGPVLTLTDTNGRVWQRTEWGWRQIEDRGWMPRRRELWFEQRSWWPKLDQWLLSRGSRKARKRPTRLPWEIRLVAWAWGYRPGRSDGGDLPWNAPSTWYYNDLL